MLTFGWAFSFVEARYRAWVLDGVADVQETRFGRSRRAVGAAKHVLCPLADLCYHPDCSCARNLAERWLSGRKQRFAKPS
jgi:hypothetical protein